MYDVVLTRETQRIYLSADARLARKLARCFLYLQSTPRTGNNVKALKGPLLGFYRFRVGDYRVVYSIDDKSRIVTVINIAHRRDVYD